MGMLLQVAPGESLWGARRRRAATVATAATAAPQQWQQQLDPGPWMPRDGDFGRRPESPTRCSMARCAASVATAWLWNAGPSASAWWIGLCRATPAPPRNSGGSRTLTRRAAVVATLTRAAVQERVETRHPSACCIRPRLRHGPAPARAGSRLSGVVTANRESRSAASCAAIVAASVRVCPIGPGGMHVAPCGVGVSRRLCFNNVHACRNQAPATSPTAKQAASFRTPSRMPTACLTSSQMAPRTPPSTPPRGSSARSAVQASGSLPLWIRCEG